MKIFPNIIKFTTSQNNTYLYINYNDFRILPYYFYFILHFLEFNNLLHNNSYVKYNNNIIYNYLNKTLFKNITKYYIQIILIILYDNIDLNDKCKTNILKQEYKQMNKIASLNIIYNCDTRIDNMIIKSYNNKINEYYDDRINLNSNLFMLLSYHCEIIYSYYKSVNFFEFQKNIGKLENLIIDKKILNSEELFTNYNIINIINEQYYESTTSLLLKLYFLYYYKFLKSISKKCKYNNELILINKHLLLINNKLSLFKILIYDETIYNKEYIEKCNNLISDINNFYLNNKINKDIYLIIGELIIYYRYKKNDITENKYLRDQYNKLYIYYLNYIKYDKLFKFEYIQCYKLYKFDLQNKDYILFNTLLDNKDKIFNIDKLNNYIDQLTNLFRLYYITFSDNKFEYKKYIKNIKTNYDLTIDLILNS